MAKRVYVIVKQNPSKESVHRAAGKVYRVSKKVATKTYHASKKAGTGIVKIISSGFKQDKKGKTWVERNWKPVVTGTAVVAVGGFAIWALYSIGNGLFGAGSQPPACTSAQNAYSSAVKQMLAINNEIATNQGSSPTASQAAAIQQLQATMNQASATMAAQCVPPAGSSIGTLIKNITGALTLAAYAAVLAGMVVVGSKVYSFVSQTVGQTGADGEFVAASDFNIASVSTNMQAAAILNAVDEGSLSTSQALSQLNSLAANDPVLQNANDFAAFWQQIADNATAGSELAILAADNVEAYNGLASADDTLETIGQDILEGVE